MGFEPPKPISSACVCTLIFPAQSAKISGKRILLPQPSLVLSINLPTLCRRSLYIEPRTSISELRLSCAKGRHLQSGEEFTMVLPSDEVTMA